MKERIENIADKIIEYSLYIMVFFIPISNAAIEICYCFMFVSFIVKKSLNPDFKFLKSPMHYFLLFFIAFSSLSMLNSGPYLKKSLITLVFKWLENIMIFIIAEDNISNNPKRLRNIILIFVIGSALIALDGIYQHFMGIDFIRHRAIPIKTHITATFKNKNGFAAYITPVLLLSISLALSQKIKKHYRGILFLLSILLGVCLILTFSRGAWIGFFIALLLMLLLSGKFKVLFPIIGGFMIILVSIPKLWIEVSSIFNSGAAGRFALWRTAWHIIQENPFLGKGLGTYMDYFGKYASLNGGLAYYAHNCFLQIWAETGIFALISFLIFLGLLLGKGIWTFNKTKDFVILGLVCGILGFMIHSLFDVHLYSLQLSVLFWLMAGILSASTKTKAIP